MTPLVRADEQHLPCPVQDERTHGGDRRSIVASLHSAQQGWQPGQISHQHVRCRRQQHFSAFITCTGGDRDDTGGLAGIHVMAHIADEGRFSGRHVEFGKQGVNFRPFVDDTAAHDLKRILHT